VEGGGAAAEKAFVPRGVREGLRHALGCCTAASASLRYAVPLRLQTQSCCLRCVALTAYAATSSPSITSDLWLLHAFVNTFYAELACHFYAAVLAHLLDVHGTLVVA